MLKKLFADLNPTETVAMCITVLFQPALIPSITLGILYAKNDSYLAIEPFVNGSNLVNWFIFLGITYIIPTTLIVVLYQTKKIADLEIRKANERHRPYLISIGWFVLILGILLFKTNQVFHSLLIAVTTLGLIALFIGNFLTKISAHSLAISAGAAIILALNPLYNNTLSIWFVILAFSTLLVTWARYTLKAHSLWQLCLGIGLGCCHYFIYLVF
jgi:hypothetical protein